MNNLNFKKQEKKFLILNRIVLTVIFVVISVIVSIGNIVNPAEVKYLWWILFGIWCFYLLFYLYKGAEFRHFSYAVNDSGLYIHRGVFWQKKIVIPRNRVQHTDVEQGPLMRKFHLAELTIHTAGTRNASIKLPGILHVDAESLREYLSFEESNDAV